MAHLFCVFGKCWGGRRAVSLSDVLGNENLVIQKIQFINL